jgi:hypothetical protein
VNVSLEDAIQIYARASRAWFGNNAREKTQERLAQLQSAGDLEGVQVYRQLDQCILKLEKEEPSNGHAW